MKLASLSFRACSPGACLLASVATTFAHGGMYRGPGATFPPGGGGPAATGAIPGSSLTAPSGAPDAGTGDTTHWGLWWQMNLATYLALKAHVHSLDVGTGSEGWFLGNGNKPEAATLRPSDTQVRTSVVPALLAVLEGGKAGNDLTTGALVALAKIGESPDGSDGARIEAALMRSLPHGNQEIRETAAVALGILASPRAIPTLAHLLWDTPTGRKSVKASEVDYRTRSFAAYGLGLIGARAEREIDRMLVVSVLRRALEGDDTRSRDLEVACLVSLGLVPLATIETPVAAASDESPPPESSRLAQLAFVFEILSDKRREKLARAQCPVTLARLLDGLPEPQLARERARVAAYLLEVVERDTDVPELVQSCILALGAIGTNDGKDELDAHIRRALANVPRGYEPQARGFALMAAAELGARMGRDDPSQGVDDVRELLVRELSTGKNTLKPWAGLASGVLCHGLAQQGTKHPAVETLRRVLRVTLEDENSPLNVGAYALGAGLARSTDCAPRMLELVEQELVEDARGQVAIGLGLLGSPAAVPPLRKIVTESRYRPELLRQSAMALGLLGDKDIGLQLAAMLKDARSLASQAAIATALGFIGDRRSIEPLLALLTDENVSERARAFAAVALGNVADKEMLPWNSKIGFGINYRAAPATLFDPGSGTGILDIL